MAPLRIENNAYLENETKFYFKKWNDTTIIVHSCVRIVNSLNFSDQFN